MIIVYVSFELDGDHAAFDEWFLPLVEETRRTPGCVAYDYLVDAVHASRRYMLEVWDSAGSIAAHAGARAHVEMLALGTPRFGMREIVIDRWDEPERHRRSTRARSDEHVDGREHVDDLIADVQRARLGRVVAGVDD